MGIIIKIKIWFVVNVERLKTKRNNSLLIRVRVCAHITD